jgi:preprotein translocase subunit YajC
MTSASVGGPVLAQVNGPSGILQTPLPVLLIVFLVFYFILIRPQQRQAKAHKEMVEGLKKNDRVITSSGLYGRIVDLSADQITLEIAPNVHIRHARSQVGSLQMDKDKKEKKED